MITVLTIWPFAPRWPLGKTEKRFIKIYSLRVTLLNSDSLINNTKLTYLRTAEHRNNNIFQVIFQFIRLFPDAENLKNSFLDIAQLPTQKVEIDPTVRTTILCHFGWKKTKYSDSLYCFVFCLLKIPHYLQLIYWDHYWDHFYTYWVYETMSMPCDYFRLPPNSINMLLTGACGFN